MDEDYKNKPENENQKKNQPLDSGSPEHSPSDQQKHHSEEPHLKPHNRPEESCHDHHNSNDHSHHGQAQAQHHEAVRNPHLDQADHIGDPHHAHHVHHNHHDHSHHLDDFKRRFWVSLALTIPILFLSEMIQKWLGISFRLPFHQYILFALSTIIFIYGGWPFLKGTIDELKIKQPGMMTLIGTAISVAFFYSSATVFFIEGQDFFWELATLIVIMLLGHWVEARSVVGASRALEELVKIMPTVAHLIQDGQVIDVPVSELKKGDQVLVRPGEKIPSDGTVTEGSSQVNESLLTGESKPVPKSSGDLVIGGSINGQGSLQITIEKTGQETYLAQVIGLVQQAQASRSRTQDLANRSAAFLFYVALAAGIISFAVWNFMKGSDFALERAVTVLVIACPHALGLAIPLVVAISTSLTARGGILIRDRRAFEAAKSVNAVVFDKTGTLTEGKFGVNRVQLVAQSPSLSSEDELLRLAAAVEMNSEHVISRAIVSRAQSLNLSIPQVQDFKAIPGKGVSSRVDGKLVQVGGASLLEELNLALEDESLKMLMKKGQTTVLVIVDGRPAGAIALSDKIRDESSEAIKKLKQMEIKVFMLTGDSEEVAKAVSEELDLDEYFSQVLPHEKAEKIKLLKSRGFQVAMVGDGLNDAPALATADVGIAIGAGTDVAIESADIILVKNNPTDVPKIINISRKTFSKMVQNLWWAAGYNIIAIPLAAGILYGQGILISPALGAVLMSLSTVIVALNSQTLRWEKGLA
ncbi:MAG: heavy metal translocating P-type ATPase [Candidatus Saccharicenans sp.]|nr:heavy metal translocating P-type ATPase [Candidatus Saccharicenans sp.]